MKPPRLLAPDTVLVVVDMQERLLPVMHGREDLMANVQLLLRAARTLDLPVLMSTQYQKGLGPTHSEIAELGPASPHLDKMSFSCFGAPAFVDALLKTGRRTILLCGVEAHICALQTGLDALAAGYQVHAVADALASRQPGNADLGRLRLQRAGAVLSSTEMAIYELLGASGTPAFKSLLPYFKAPSR